MKLPLLASLGLLGSLGALAAVNQTYDLRTGLGSVNVGGVLFFPGESSYYTAQSTGTGVFTPFNTYKGASGVDYESGYNSNGVGDNPMTDTFGGAQRNLRVQISDLANSIVTVSGTQYYFISTDQNEDNSRPGSYISFDQMQLFVRSSPYVANPGDTDAQKLSGLRTSSTKIWDLDLTLGTSGSAYDREILIDTLPYSGSGRADAFMLIPKALLDPYSSSYYFYLFAEQGHSTTFANLGKDSSFEEWDLVNNTIGGFTFTPPPPVPEATTVGAAAVLGLGLAGHFLRRRK